MEDIALMVVTSPSRIGFTSKIARSLATKLGATTAKMARSLKILSKKSESSGALVKATKRTVKIIVLKRGFRHGIKISTKTAIMVSIKLGAKASTITVKMVLNRY